MAASIKLLAVYLFLKNNFIYFWLGWVFVAAHRLSLAAASGGYSLVVECGPHERLTDLAVVPREKPHTGAAAREQPRASPVIAT